MHVTHPPHSLSYVPENGSVFDPLAAVRGWRGIEAVPDMPAKANVLRQDFATVAVHEGILCIRPNKEPSYHHCAFLWALFLSASWTV